MSDSRAEESTPGRVSILIVDDSPVMRKMIRRSLSVAAVPSSMVFEADNGEAAFGLLQREVIDIMLCDIHMPVLGGIDLVRRMAETGILERVPVVMITSERNEAQTAELTRLGVRGCVHKPFYPEVLGDVIRSVLGLAGAP